MAFEKLVEVIHSSVDAGWKDRNEAALASLFGSAEGRYPQAASGEIALRAPAMGGETGVSLLRTSILPTLRRALTAGYHS